jgi:HSP20 family protein
MPGIKEKDINVTISGDNLEIKGEKKYEEEKKEKGSYYSEREFGSFYRSMLLPDSVTADKIQAKYKNGVLKLTLPKSEEKKQDVKKIEIQKD